MRRLSHYNSRFNVSMSSTVLQNDDLLSYVKRSFAFRDKQLWQLEANLLCPSDTGLAMKFALMVNSIAED